MIELITSSFFSLPKEEQRKNQDSILPVKKVGDNYLFAVADGVGSYAGAKEASTIAINYLNQLQEDQLHNIDNIFNNIRNQIIELSDSISEFDKAATTLTFGIFNHNGLLIGHIGDCRLYVAENGKLRQKTKDHTSHQRLLDKKIYTKKELKEISGKNVINEAITKRFEMNYDTLFIPMSDIRRTDDNVVSFYIMSDGAHQYWEHRPRFSLNTISHTDSFSSSLRKRIEKNPTDDYSLVAVQFKIY
ncbi:protein phosphatase 2C domain-containing protein [Glaesserella parasuis]|uniref:Protein phosphatase 2C domain-containing protein n=1 Tax=Glaesserella parasuis TaxID=738 RepID=A0AAX1M307_GLAPU|nr:protein phosphatase 2C domain-containing protein [Glaesserella parasuis]EQA13043.1 phosphatase 2C family protein [Glaesserella parasuis 174]MCT8517303.1 protein phosphatase 2C domain-containing protein [Glaesserella parasuis]MCT8543960.1 protein phosphatase 2C domain-containing protein [Glaesserella parasuis]MCT8550041.1 protein phosphatase 2C domain-containing protein [Glaesserella parasuis]MCT8572375.1 protein phosphatase 2C domain-containing protein [Glaesserella parasuis]